MKSIIGKFCFIVVVVAADAIMGLCIGGLIRVQSLLFETHAHDLGLGNLFLGFGIGSVVGLILAVLRIKGNKPLLKVGLAHLVLACIVAGITAFGVNYYDWW